MSVPHLVAVVLDDRLVSLNALVGLLRRKRAPVRGLSVTPGPVEGLQRLVVVVDAPADAVHRLTLLCRRSPGVRDAWHCLLEEAHMREIALVRLRPRPDSLAELFDTVSLFQGVVLEEGAEHLVVELSGSAEFVLSGVRALERFHVTDVARSGAAVPRGAARPRPQAEAAAS